MILNPLPLKNNLQGHSSLKLKIRTLTLLLNNSLDQYILHTIKS